MTAAAQGACTQLLDFTVGSVLRALTEANASAGLWLQWLIVLLMQRQRLATSVGVDVDSFVGDYGITRLPGVASSGVVTLSRFFATNSATILAGETLVRTGDGSQTFTILADSTSSLWNPALTDPTGAVVGGFVIPPGTFSTSFTVQNQVQGSAGNVSANTITVLATGVSGVDTVTNSVAFTNGVDSETDAALRARFQAFIGSLSKATLGAVSAAIAGVQSGLTFSVTPNVDTDGLFKPGKFVVTVDDGTGSPPSGLLTAISNAIQPVRSLCETYAVEGPAVTHAAIVLTITVAAGYVKANLLAPVATAIDEYVNSLPFGATLPYSKVASVVYGVSAGITNVTAFTINSGTSDITASPSTVIRTSPNPVIN